jgi:hypothetical protein
VPTGAHGTTCIFWVDLTPLSRQRALPIGFWKGSGLTIALDMIAAALASGNAGHRATLSFYAVIFDRKCQQ